MIRRRRTRRTLSYLAALLLALHPLVVMTASALASVSEPGFGDGLVICSASGAKTITAQGDEAPAPGPSHGQCPHCDFACLTGCGSHPSADLSTIAGPGVVEPARAVAFETGSDAPSPGVLHGAASPRGPPPA